ncbi:Zn-dependent membrane protease YugP [Natronospira proteinivora]|uniref:Zn-dependent membrane protease YugP n=1 Tax=Natronospira proteinivora TaxID=1807133 RepID=A0ABT1GAE8_9GAMM|nr:Zn-dependent membrane protease YugP [Natronospira proteinivora]
MSYQTVEKFKNSLEAEVAKARLEAEGIPVLLAGVGLGPLVGFFNPRSNFVRLKVPEERMREAREILDTDWSAEVDEQWDQDQ